MVVPISRSRKPPDGKLISSLQVPGHAAYTEQVRGLTSLLLLEAGCACEEFRYTLRLLASELFANAVAHGIAPINVYCLHHERSETVTVVVQDRSKAMPVLRPRSGMEVITQQQDHGFGLLLVGSLATEWGYRPLGDGKEVWFTVRVHDCDAD